jgi:hypothetical protein
VITGIQALFAFLLVVPFDIGFAGIDRFERTVYFVTLILAALSAVLTMTRAAWHRIVFRHDDTPHLVCAANRCVLAGLACLALAMCGSLLLVGAKLFGTTVGSITVFVASWYSPCSGSPCRCRVADRAGRSPRGRSLADSTEPPIASVTRRQ